MSRRANQHQLIALLLISALTLGGCGNSAESGSTTTTTGTAETTEPPTEATPTTPEATTSTTVTATAAIYPAGYDWQPVVLLTSREGAGARPIFSWEPVPGAAGYLLILLDANGEAYWSWEGEATETVLGGLPVLEEGIAGPSLTPGMTWSVSAYDADLRSIGLSEFRSISP